MRITDSRQPPAVQPNTDNPAPTRDVALSPEEFDARPDLKRTEAEPRPLAQAQKRAIQIMLGQLSLHGQEVTDLLELHYNRQNLEDLTYREAAGLIAYLSRLLKERIRTRKRVV